MHDSSPRELVIAMRKNACQPGALAREIIISVAMAFKAFGESHKIEGSFAFACAYISLRSFSGRADSLSAAAIYSASPVSLARRYSVFSRLYSVSTFIAGLAT